MKTIMNQARFLKVVEYISAHFFSKPYSITRVVDRWFNQLSMIELANGRMVSLTGETARQHIDIMLDGEVVPKDDVQLIRAYYSKQSNPDEARAKMVRRIEVLTSELAKVVEPLRSQEETEELQRKLDEQQKKLTTFDENREKAKALYEAIVERGESRLNEASIEATYHSKIKKIIHRPNHGLTHSVRAAYSIANIHAFRKAQSREFMLDDEALEKLQFMMLFSVVGRLDETGFNDTGPASGPEGRQTYESFRVTSGREYLKYTRDNARHVYGDDLETLYRDAIVVELMGYSTIEDCINRRRIPPELFVDYVIEKESRPDEPCSRERAIALIAQHKYSLANLFSPGASRTQANAMLGMMNDAHGLDLTRCYSLYPKKYGGSKSVGIINYHLWQTDFFNFTDAPSEDKLISFFNLMRSSFDALEATGESTLFGLPSYAAFATEKDEILRQVQAVSDDFKDPARRSALLKEAQEELEKAKTAQDGAYFISRKHGDGFLRDYRNYKIVNAIAEALNQNPKLKSDRRMFDFQHTKGDNPHDIDHHQNAVNLVQAMQKLTPFSGVDVTPLPTITEVKHNRLTNKVTLIFDDESNATYFQDTYDVIFGTKLDIQVNEQGQHVIEVNRVHYKQLLSDRLIEFKPVTIPKAVERETSLVDDNGVIEAINLVKRSRALVRLVSTTPLSGEDFPDYDYLFRALDDPLHERYTPPIADMADFPVDHHRYYDPRTGTLHRRAVLDSPRPELRFQEPVMHPASFEDKVADGWTVSKGGGPKNTIYTKKLAHSLLPPHGRMEPFAGYYKKRSNYFPIGVLSDISLVDLKDERYVWAGNMASVKRHWLRDPTVYNRKMYQSLHAKLDGRGVPIRDDATGDAVLDIDKLRFPASPTVLVKDLERRAVEFVNKLGEKAYRPTKRTLRDFRALFQQEKEAYLAHLGDNEAAKEKVHAIYQGLERVISKEEERSTIKYSMSVRELIKLQRQQNKRSTLHVLSELPDNKKDYKQQYILVDRQVYFINSKSEEEKVPIADFERFSETLTRLNPHGFDSISLSSKKIKELITDNGGHVPNLLEGNNELLVGATKSAVRALYASKDTLFERLNLAFHAMEIKAKYRYDVPLLIMSQDKEPYHYSEAMIKADLLEAFHALQANRFPYESKAEHVAYDDEGHVKKTERGREVHVPKNMRYQKQLLVDIFKLGLPKLKTIGQLEHGRIKQEELTETRVGQAIETIVGAMNVIGSETRERQLMERVFAEGDVKKRHDFFVRAAALGHQSIVKIILARDDYKPMESVLLKAATVAKNNGHSELGNFLTQPQQLKTLLDALQSTKHPDTDSVEQYEHQIHQVIEINKLAEALHASMELPPTLKQSLQHQDVDKRLLRTSSRTLNNKEHLKSFLTLLADHMPYVELYAKLLAANRPIKLVTLIDAHHRYGVEVTTNAMSLIAEKGWDSGEQYLQLKALNDDKRAGRFLVDTEKELVSTKDECMKYLNKIKEAGWGVHDSKTQDFYDMMQEAILLAGDNIAAQSMHLTKLKSTYEAVTSPEMLAIKEAVARLEKRARGWTIIYGIGNQKKADNIRQAVCNVSLSDRLHVFTDENNDACNQVRIALASHRFEPWRVVKQDEHTGKARVDLNAFKLASSFTNMDNAIAKFKKHKAELIDIKGDEEQAVEHDETQLPKH